MRFIDFDSMSDFAKKLIRVSKSNGDDNSYCGIAICNYEVATQLLEELAKCDQKFRHIDLSAPEVSGYLKEYAIMVTEKGIYCEKIYKSNKRYIKFKGCSVPVYVHGESSKEIESIVNADSFVFNIAPKKHENEKDSKDDIVSPVYEFLKIFS